MKPRLAMAAGSGPSRREFGGAGSGTPVLAQPSGGVPGAPSDGPSEAMGATAALAGWPSRSDAARQAAPRPTKPRAARFALGKYADFASRY